MKEVHYRQEDGISGYREGDILVNDTTGERSIVVLDGRGLCLRPEAAAGSSDIPPAEADCRNASIAP